MLSRCAFVHRLLGLRVWRKVACAALVAIAAIASGCHGDRRFTDGPLGRRFYGPVRVSLTAALIAPGKDSGLPWDGFGQLPLEVADGLRRPRPSGLTGELFRALTAGTGMGELARLIPWAANSFMSGLAAPDTIAEISLDGRLLRRTEVVANSYSPTWAGEYTPPIEIGESSQLEIRATDYDPTSGNDPIGVCTSQGMPWVDQRGYASGDTFQCFSQLWAVAVRIVPATEAIVPAAEAPPAKHPLDL